MDKVKIGSNIYESKLPNGSVLFWSYNTVVAANLAKWLSGLDYKTVTQKYLDSFKG